MKGPPTHFPPQVAKRPRRAVAVIRPVVSITALAGVSAWVRDAFGDRVIERANRAAMLDIEVIEDQDCFIPRATMAGFLAEIERQTGQGDFGLLIAPRLSVTRYGTWGAYVPARLDDRNRRPRVGRSGFSLPPASPLRGHVLTR